MDAQQLMERLSHVPAVGRSFGPAFERGEVLIIPVALVAGGGGFGESEDAPGRNPHAAPPGIGGGMGGLSLPLGVYEVTAAGVRFVPAFDLTRIVTATIGLVKFAVGMWRRVADRRAAART